MSIATHAKDALARSSWIRRMFEHGAALKAERGEHAIIDLSLGNPDLPPPKAFYDTLTTLISTRDNRPSPHRYMNNAGFLATRSAIAAKYSAIERKPLRPDDVMMTVGAAGALNCILRSLLDPDDEVIFPAPYFAEYPAYIAHSQGHSVVVPSNNEFGLNIDAIAGAITPKTKVLLLNSPNNPTGYIYSNDDMSALAALITDRPIYVIMDAAYARMCYAGAKNPAVFTHFKRSFVVHSHSKDLGLAGERIGFVLINPDMPHLAQVRAALVMMNRSLGFVNAPALMQRVLPYLLDEAVDTNSYRERINYLGTELKQIGYELTIPQAGFFLWVRIPGDTSVTNQDTLFCTQLANDGVLTVPGRGFGCAGYMRISCCVNMAALQKSLPVFAQAFSRAVSSDQTRE